MIPVADLAGIASSPDFDAFSGGFGLMIASSLLTAFSVGLINFIRRVIG